MRRIGGIQRKLAAAIMAATALSLGLLGALMVRSLAGTTRERVHSGALSAVHLRAAEVARFFTEHGRIATTMLGSPHLLEWFERYDTFRRPLAGDDGYRLVNRTFADVLAAHPALINAFFSTEATGEYFKAEGRVEREGYDPKSRRWWSETLERGRLYVARPLIGASTGKPSVSVQMPVRRADGRLLGVGGLDFKLETVESLVGGLAYRGEGAGFLIESGGRIVAFPALGLPAETAIETPVGRLDQTLTDTAGFAALEPRMRSGEEGSAPVRFKGRSYLAFFSPVRASHPDLAWSLGLLIPTRAVTAPVRGLTLGLGAGLVAIIIGIGALMIVVTRTVVTRPIGGLVERVRDVVSGSGDLTRRVEVASDDEIGELARLFNTMLGRLQEDVATISHLANALGASAQSLSGLSWQIAQATDRTSEQAAAVSAAADQVSGSVQAVASGTEQMVASIREIARSSRQAAEVAQQAVELAGATAERFEQLRGSGERIGHVARLIGGVADQTNLLALNATIEAVRAGDAGRGFAVVANEVKQLAGQTAEATGQIVASIGAMQAGTETAGQTVGTVADIVNQINESQSIIATAVEEQTASTAEIGRSVSEAARGTGEIADSVAAFAKVARDTASDAGRIEAAARQLATSAAELQEIVARFTH